MSQERRTIAVALHDIEPATFERCALIRDWLDDHRIDRVTLLVIPARDLHPLAGRSPDMVRWLIERERQGDAIAQHGFQHLRSQPPRGPIQAVRALGGRRRAEFLGLDRHETRRAVDAGRRVLKLAGIEPHGFVAPSYAYTSALQRTLGERFHWWTALLGLHRSQPRGAREGRAGEEETAKPRRRTLLGPPISLSSSGRMRHLLSPALLRAGAVMSGTTLRLDLHPSDLDHPNHMLALEWVLHRAGMGREAVTYEELALGGKRCTSVRSMTAARYPSCSSEALKGFSSERPA